METITCSATTRKAQTSRNLLPINYMQLRQSYRIQFEFQPCLRQSYPLPAPSVASKTISDLSATTSDATPTTMQFSVATSSHSTFPANQEATTANEQTPSSKTDANYSSSAAVPAAGHALSPAAIAGIVFGAIALLSLMCVGFFLVHWMGQSKAGKRPRTRGNHAASIDTDHTVYMHPENQLSEMSSDCRPFEIGEGYHAELPTPMQSKHQKQASLGLEHFLKMKL